MRQASLQRHEGGRPLHRRTLLAATLAAPAVPHAQGWLPERPAARDLARLLPVLPALAAGRGVPVAGAAVPAGAPG